ncbi:hypothetical protein AB205_0205650, partial [Aquarana catesbeiana]
MMIMLAGSSILLAGIGVTSQPICPNGGTNCQIPTSALFDRAVKLSHYIHSLSSEMFNEFIQPGDLENEIYSPWPGPASIPGDENSRLFAFYNLLHCLRRDSHKIDNYLKLLKCRLIHEGNC